MKKYFMLVLILIFSVNLAYAGRVYTYTRTVGPETGKYDFTTINDAIADIQTYELSPEQLGCIFVYPGTYIEQINSFYPGGHNLPEHCDLIGMGENSGDVVIQHKRRSTSDPNFTNIYSEIYADGLLCDGDNIVSKLKVHNVGENQNSVRFMGEGTLRNCIIVSKHNALTALKHLVVKNCDIEGKYLPCIQAYSTFEISDSNLFPKTRPWGGEHPAGIKVRYSGTIDNVTIEADIASSDYEPHYDTPWLAGVILQLRSPDDIVTITNATMNLKLKTIYHDDRPNETADWELFGVISGGRNPEPTTSYPGRAILKDCKITLDGVEDSSNPNGDGRAIMVAGVCVQGGGRVDVIGNTSIRTGRTAAGFGEEGYEYSLNNQNGILTVDFNTVDFDETITNGLITAFDPNEPVEPNEPEPDPEPEPEPEPNQPTTVDGYPEAKPRQTEEKVMYICPDYKKKDSKGYPDKDPNGTKWQPTSGGGTKDGGDVYINSDITTNTLWTKDNIYHITADVNVTALLVIEPGTIIGHSQGVGMFVNNGGAVIAIGNAEWPIVFTSDVFPHWYDDYYCGLYIEETASSATAVQNCIFEFSQIGVCVNNKRLQKPIKHNQFHRCVVGILEAGPNHTDIINNACYYQYDTGIEVYMEKMPESIGDADSHILIQGNTCFDYNWWGITVHGATDANYQPDPNNAGTVVIANNIVAWCYDAGLCLVDGAMYASVLNTGYYENYMNKNWDFDETDPVEATEYPFQTGDLGYLSLVYLNPACPFINAGVGIVHQTGVMGHTTDVNGIPDSNVTDIGFHWYHPRYDNVGEGDYYQSDLDQNLIVDLRDFAILANGWQITYDINDLAELCDNWLRQGGPAQNITPSFDQDPNNFIGDVNVTVNVTDSDIERVYMFVDDEKYLQYGDVQENPTAYLETKYFCNGPHTVKIITQDSNNMVYCSEAVDVNFGNTVNSLQMDESFTPGEDYHIMALGSGNYDISVYDIVNETTTYSDTSTGEISITVPTASFPEEYGAYDFKMAPQGAPDNPLFNFLIRRKFSYAELYGTGGGAKATGSWVMKMVVSIGGKKLEKAKEKCWRAALRAGVKKGFAPGIIVPSDRKDWFDCLALALTFEHCKIWYHVGHGNYKALWKPERTFISTPSGKIFSYLKKDLVSPPPDYEDMGGYEKNHSIAELGFYGADDLIWVQINACYSHRNLDFPVYCGTPNDDFPEDPIGDQVYIGWHDSALVHDILGAYNQFEYDYWEYLRQGYNLETAVDWALPPAGGTRIRENFKYFGVSNWQFAWFRHPNIN